ncbi:hypothetical protein [Helicobacter ailurogastricus]|uniref:Uncharacterized protein n=1 Tax=Helicobacter ailurogastricus TaxID=1578720 RepID=A0A0K2X785_9HELI|nr:hypothetical protein [Helicobacter ailurogastricus]CRF40968.1 hypothetical protein HAL011_07440 [Helicobacter ailurogastricus]CRF42357.1 hypothetical protein HAL013_05270 [Helicobacter ailurogastricus]CRF44612.1 hypothetical protein HAL09_12060 [Helicobacter ailurogastricus]
MLVDENKTSYQEQILQNKTQKKTLNLLPRKVERYSSVLDCLPTSVIAVCKRS